MDLVDRFAAMCNEREMNLVRELFADDYWGMDMTTQTQSDGPAGVIARLEKIYRVFPDLEFSAQQAVLENQQFALQWRVRGTHRGVFMNIPPTGQTVEINGATFLTLRGEKIQRAVHLWDMAAMLRAVGLLPELEQRALHDTLWR